MKRKILCGFLILSSFYLSSCNYVGEKFFGDDYYNQIIRTDFDIAFCPDSTSETSRKIISDIENELWMNVND